MVIEASNGTKKLKVKISPEQLKRTEELGLLNGNEQKEAKSFIENPNLPDFADWTEETESNGRTSSSN